MSPELVNKINADTRKALADPGTKSKLEGLGNATLDMSPAEFKKLVHDETESNRRLLTAAGVKPQ
jgi:tripartite-type tricarboxylate transporter receptor subunit TctC